VTFRADSERTEDLIAGVITGAKNGEVVFEVRQIETAPLLQAANIISPVTAAKKKDYKEVIAK
jgi:hypothetical protein